MALGLASSVTQTRVGAKPSAWACKTKGVVQVAQHHMALIVAAAAAALLAGGWLVDAKDLGFGNDPGFAHDGELELGEGGLEDHSAVFAAARHLPQIEALGGAGFRARARVPRLRAERSRVHQRPASLASPRHRLIVGASAARPGAGGSRRWQ